VFPAGSDSRLLETRLQAIRLSPYRADLPARRPVRIGSSRRFPGMLLSPVTFQITGQPSDPKTPPPVHARCAGHIAVRLVAHTDHPFARGTGRPANRTRVGAQSGRHTTTENVSTTRPRTLTQLHRTQSKAGLEITAGRRAPDFVIWAHDHRPRPRHVTL